MKEKTGYIKPGLVLRQVRPKKSYLIVGKRINNSGIKELYEVSKLHDAGSIPPIIDWSTSSYPSSPEDLKALLREEKCMTIGERKLNELEEMLKGDDFKEIRIILKNRGITKLYREHPFFK